MKILFNGKIPPFINNGLKLKKISKIFILIVQMIQYYNYIMKKVVNIFKYHIKVYLYHLGNDICNFNVPIFICDLEIKIKIHNRKKCKLSIMIACKSKNIKY